MTLPPTPSQTVGPFYSIGLERRPQNELVPRSDAGALRLRGRLLDGAGEPMDGVVELWDPRSRRWGRSGTDTDGWFEFAVAKPPGDGREAPRLDVYVLARGLLAHQLTRMYFPDEREANDADPVLSALAAGEHAVLVAREEADGLRFDIRMQGEDAAVFFAV
jgi:protocatechuate 3,4-dioxygenase, alpha subunit